MLSMRSNYVLVVEDDPCLRPLIQAVLSANGFDPRCAANAAEALSVSEQTGKTLQVALVDLTLPGAMTGEELIEQLKGQNPNLSLVITSGRLPPEDLLERLRDAAYLQKPFLPSELLRAVRTAFKKVSEPKSVAP